MVGRAYLGTMATLVLLYYVAAPLRGIAASALAILATAAIVAGIARSRPHRAGGWVLLAGATALLGTANVLLTVAGGAAPGRFPTPADVLYVLTYPPLAIGLIWL